jgi:hypothetical protein
VDGAKYSTAEMNAARKGLAGRALNGGAIGLHRLETLDDPFENVEPGVLGSDTDETLCQAPSASPGPLGVNIRGVVRRSNSADHFPGSSFAVQRLLVAVHSGKNSLSWDPARK